MFLKRCTRKKDGKPHTYWQLVESYRTPRGSRHRVVAYLGDCKQVCIGLVATQDGFPLAYEVFAGNRELPVNRR